MTDRTNNIDNDVSYSNDPQACPHCGEPAEDLILCEICNEYGCKACTPNYNEHGFNWDVHNTCKKFDNFFKIVIAELVDARDSAEVKVKALKGVLSTIALHSDAINKLVEEAKYQDVSYRAGIITGVIVSEIG